MKIDFSFRQEFKTLYSEFQRKHPELLALEGISPDKLDIANMSKQYFTKRIADYSVDENANANEEMGPNNYQSEIIKGIVKLEGYYLLWKYSQERYGTTAANRLLRSIWNGNLYFHDAGGHGIQIPYCFAYSTTNLLLDGRPYGQLQSMPPKRADSFVAQVIETTMDLSQEFAGAISPSDFLVNYAWFAKAEQLSDKQIVNDMQKLVHVLNNKFRTSGQSPFTNVSLFDRPNLQKVFGETLYPDGTSPDFDYVMKVQKLFGEWFAKGDPVTGLPYRFPVVTVNLSVDGNRQVEDKDFLDWVAWTNIDRGCFNIYINEGHKIATCCRYSNDFSQIRADSFGNGGLNLGSHRVVTLNLPRIALEAHGNRSQFFVLLYKQLEDARCLLNVHREDILQRRIDVGFLKFFKPLNWFTLDSLFSTFGIVGIYEACHFMDLPMETEDGVAFTEEVLAYIEDYAKQASLETGNPFNVEEIPAESTAPKLAKKDRLFFPEQEFELYSNQYIPLIADVGTMQRIHYTGKFMKYLSGGGILHLNIQEKLTEPQQMRRLIELAISQGVEHFAINYGFGTCVNGHTTVVGSGTECPICEGEITDWLTRIIGYFTKTSSWNDVRRNYDYPNRKWGALL